MFSKGRDEVGVELVVDEHGEVLGVKTVIGIYCMKNIFNKK